MQSREELTFEGSRKKSTKTKNILLALVALMTIATIVLAVLYGIEVNKSSDTVVTDTTSSPPITKPTDTQEGICEDEACVAAASRILQAMDTTIDPCEDFFEYACGAWNRDHIIADDQSRVSTFDELRDDVSAVLKRVLEREDTTNTDRESIVKAKQFYALCMDTSTIDTKGITPVLELIAQMDGWPVLGNAFNASDYNLEESLAKFRSFGTYGILASWVSADDKSSKDNILQIDQPSLGMPNRDYYLDENKRSATEPGYRKYMKDLIMALGQKNETIVDDVVDKILTFETSLAGSMAPDSERRDSLAIYNKMSINDISSNINSQVDWLTYFNTLLKSTGITVDGSEPIVVYAPEYIKNMTAIINEDYELVQNYLVWRVLKGRMAYMSADLRATQAPYTQAVSGTTAEKARWKTCSDATNSYFPMPVGSLFVQEVFPEENKKVTEEMVVNLNKAFLNLLPQNDWMDDATKNETIKKANLISPLIGYPDYIVDVDDDKMDADLIDATVTADEYFQTIQSLATVDNDKSFGELRNEIDFNEWIVGPAIVNAFYQPTKNQIFFPAGILQAPFSDAGQPVSMNYGGIGMVIGHEITHGFDDSGAQFNGEGNLENWWTADSQEKFEEKAKCMSDQYSAIQWDVANNMNIDGDLTLGENIADNGGLREAYDAYKTWQIDHPEGDLRLPGLAKFTQAQLFFLGYAQVWCGTYTEAYAIRLLTTDPHSPGKFRVNVPVYNLPYFGEAFNCKKGVDAMYPDPTKETTCRVW